MRDPFSFEKKHQPEKGVWHNKGDEVFTSPTKAAAQKKYGTTSQGILPYILAGSIGLGGGGAATQYFGKDVVTPQTLERHVDRVLDKIDDVSEDLSDLKATVKHLEKEVVELKFQDRRSRVKPTFDGDM